MTDRRTFLKGAGAASVAGAMGISTSASSYANILGANDRVNVAVMGANSRGNYLMKTYAQQKNTSITHICDVDSNVLSKNINEAKGLGHKSVKADKDVRKTLEDKNLDLLVIAAPDHWHTPAALMALQAGKNVYVEKPCGHNPREGEMLVQAQKKYGKHVQMGNQMRSCAETNEIIGLIHGGIIGDVYHAETWYSNSRKSIGNGKKIAVPSHLDWELWQGPAPRRDLLDNIVHYNWHWRWHWGTAEVSNNATHTIDIARWAMQADYATGVNVETARNFYRDDDWEMYDTMRARWAFEGGKSIEWRGNSCNKVAPMREGLTRGILLFGTEGSVLMDTNFYEIKDLNGKVVKRVDHRVSNTVGGNVSGGGANTTGLHADNLLSNIRGTGNGLNSPIWEGAKSTLMTHQANIAHRVDRPLVCDGRNGRVIDDAEAMTHWSREYESGWEPKV